MDNLSKRSPSPTLPSKPISSEVIRDFPPNKFSVTIPNQDPRNPDPEEKLSFLDSIGLFKISDQEKKGDISILMIVHVGGLTQKMKLIDTVNKKLS